jgi:hypothetical protein
MPLNRPAKTILSRYAVILIYPFLACFLPGIGAASDIFVHRTLTHEALTRQGWTDNEAIERVIDANVATDIGRLPGHSRLALSFVLPKTAEQIPAVQELAESADFSVRATVGFHFNSLYTFSDITTQWQDLNTWVNGACDLIARDPVNAYDRYFVLVGVVSHAVQDFYAHSNWVGIVNLYTLGDFVAEEFPLWEELIENESRWGLDNPGFPCPEAKNRFRASNAFMSDVEELGGLQTGRVRSEKTVGTAPWLHRHKRGAERDVVHALAVRATQLWLTRIDERIGAARRLIAETPAGLPTGAASAGLR